ncbi:MAG: hypothetical protein P8N76_14435 [Pirellulaceae bacterium]|nr:hypothetical protein [Pirellulaceae bacterium]
MVAVADVAKLLVVQMPDVATMVATLVVIQDATTDAIPVVAIPSRAVVAKLPAAARKSVVVVCWITCSPARRRAAARRLAVVTAVAKLPVEQTMVAVTTVVIRTAVIRTAVIRT